MADLPFDYAVEVLPGEVLQIDVKGYLDGAGADRYLAHLARLVEQEHAGRPLSLLYLEHLAGFESLKVPRRHGEFFRAHATRIRRVAIVTEKATITFGLAVAKLIASPRQDLKTFPTVEAALRWLRGDEVLTPRR